jgi:AraC-like DNA-binding protein
MDYRVRAVIRQLDVFGIPPSNPHDRAAQARYVASLAQVSLDELAVSVNLSVSRLRALFKAETGMTIAQYMKRQRMHCAKELVGTTYLRIGEVATTLKFEDVSHFVRDFKRTFGVTPVTYRKAINEDSTQATLPLNNHWGC